MKTSNQKQTTRPGTWHRYKSPIELLRLKIFGWQFRLELKRAKCVSNLRAANGSPGTNAHGACCAKGFLTAAQFEDLVMGLTAECPQVPALHL